jgi:hypothetical protein
VSGLKVALGPENKEAEKLLPDVVDDGSGVGINYADAYIKGIKVTLEDGRKITLKRRGLKISITVGDKTGDGLLRRLANGPDEKNMLREALKEAARNAGAAFEVENGVMFLELSEGS